MLNKYSAARVIITDPDSSSWTYQWSKVSGPGTITFTSPTSAVTNLSSAVVGNYIIRCTVTDLDGNQGYDDANFMVSSGPAVTADAKTFRRDITNKTLTGSVVLFPNTTISSYLWTYVSGPINTAPLTTANLQATLDAGITGVNASGNYVYRLTVTDSDGFSGYADAAVHINYFPVPNVGSNAIAAIGSVFNRTSIDSDQDGAVASRLWTWVSGPDQPALSNANTATVSFTPTTYTEDIANPYILQYALTDNTGDTATAQLTVRAGHQPTISSIVASQQDINDSVNAFAIGEPTITLTATASSNDTAEGLTYNWVQPANSTVTPNGTTATFTTNTVANYTVNLTVTDTLGLVSTVSSIVIKASHRPTFNNVAILPAAIGEVYALPSNTADQDTLTGATYLWTWVSGPDTPALSDANTSTVSFTPTTYTVTSQNYVLKGTIKDNIGLYKEKNFTVSAGHRPTVNSGVDFVIGTNEAGALAANASSQDPNEGITYLWSKVSGPATTINTPTQANTTFTTANNGTYVFRCLVTDNLGLTQQDDVQCIVSAHPTVNVGATAAAPIGEAFSRTAVGADDGNIVSYLWTWVSGPDAPALSNANTATVSFTPITYTENPVNRYTLRCTVTDNVGLTGASDLIVKAGNRPTISSVTASSQNANDLANAFDLDDPVVITMTATGNPNNAGESNTYAWSQPANSMVSPSGGANTTATFNTFIAGNYTVNVTATNTLGLVTLAATSIVIKASHRPVFDNHALLPAPIGEGAYTVVSGASDQDAGNNITYLWSWISGPDQPALSSTTGSSTSFIPTTYTENPVNRYTLKCDIIDNSGLYNTHTYTIKAGHRPINNAGINIFVRGYNTPLYLSGTASDIDSDIVSHQWTLNPNPSGLNVFNSTSLANAYIYPGAVSAPTANLLTTDTIGLSVQTSKQITIEDSTYIFGGFNPVGNLVNTMWRWTGSTWVQLAPASLPTPRENFALVYIADTYKLLLFGGWGLPVGGNEYTYLNDTWEFDVLNNTWTQLFPATSPSGRHGARMFPTVGGIMLFGGASGLTSNETWLWNGNNWTLLNPFTKPSGRTLHVMYAGIAGSNSVYMHGGMFSNGTATNESWYWNGNDWQGPGNLGPAVYGHATNTSGSIMFGGKYANNSYSSETWDLSNMVQKFPATSPSPRSFLSIGSTGLPTLFGGHAAGGTVGDTWQWSGVNWVLKNPATTPGSREGQGGA